MLRRLNKRGVYFSISVFHRLIIPGLFSGILSAILIAIDQVSTKVYIKYVPSYRTNVGQGGFQLIGVLLTMGIASVTGLLIGFLYKAINRNETLDQFNDKVIYSPERGKKEQDHVE